MEDKTSLNGLRRRLPQILMKSAQHRKDVYVQYVNSSSFTWQDAFHKLVNMKTPVICHYSLTYPQLMEIGRKLVSFHSGYLEAFNIGMEFAKQVSEPIIIFFSSVVSSLSKSGCDYNDLNDGVITEHSLSTSSV